MATPALSSVETCVGSGAAVSGAACRTARARSWLTRTCATGSSAVEAAGEFKVIHGAEPKEEIGGIVDLYQRRMGNPAVMFDDVPGFPKGHRVLANILTSVPRINIALGLPPQGSEMELVHWWRDYMRDAPTWRCGASLKMPQVSVNIGVSSTGDTRSSAFPRARRRRTRGPERTVPKQLAPSQDAQFLSR
jgi:3-octaprenyl-4-hydroxybenzoate carboxy-lyase N-terminal domain